MEEYLTSLHGYDQRADGSLVHTQSLSLNIILIFIVDYCYSIFIRIKKISNERIFKIILFDLSIKNFWILFLNLKCFFLHYC